MLHVHTYSRHISRSENCYVGAQRLLQVTGYFNGKHTTSYLRAAHEYQTCRRTAPAVLKSTTSIMLMLLMSTVDQSMLGIPSLHTLVRAACSRMACHTLPYLHAPSGASTHPSLRSIVPRGRKKNARCVSSEKANAETSPELAPITVSAHQRVTM